MGALRRSAGALAVHAATDRLDLPVEVHLVRADEMPGGPEAFVSVVRRAADVRHESLLPIVTGGRSGDLLFAAAKTIDAPGLDEVISRGGALAEDRVLGIGTAVASVLAALERAGMRHGDLTARRVSLPGRGQVAVGPPRLVPASRAPRNERYQSPEEARGGEGDVRSDLYVLGLLLAEALRGGPIVAGPASEARKAIAEGRVAPSFPGARAETRQVLARLLAADPAARFPTAAAAEAALRAALAGDAAPIQEAPVAVAIPAPAADRPETAPVPIGVVQEALRAAAATGAAARTPTPAPSAPPASGEPPAGPAAPAIQRSPGRVYLKGRLGETLLEIDETVHVGKPASALDIAARTDPFPEAEFRIERGETEDVVHATGAALTVNGRSAASHVLQHGDVIAGPTVTGRYERAARAALRATGAGAGPPPNPAPARLLLVASLLIALGAIAVSLPRLTGPRESADEAETAAAKSARALDDARRARSTGPAPGGTSPGGAAASREQAARDAYEAARDWARKNPGDGAGMRTRLQEVVDRYGDTGHGAIARAELLDSDRASRGAGGGELDRLVADARRQSEDGQLDASLASLRKWAEARAGTVAAERALAAAFQIENEVLGRFEADVARVERALAQKDWNGALRMVSRMMDYAPLSLRDRARELMRRAESGRDGKDAAPGAPKAPEPPKPGTAGPTPQPPAPEPGPGTGPGTGEAPPAPGGDRDKEADAAFRAAKRLMESGKDAEAIDALLAFLRDYKDTKPGARYDVEARGRITALAQGPAGVQKLFRGRSEKIDRGRWRIHYDFESADQIQDFRDVEAFEAPPRAQWKVVDGGARAKGSGSLVLDAVFQADQLVVSVNVSPERAHDLGVTFLDGAEPRRFYLYTLQNSFFTLGKGDAAKVFEENAIVLFGPGMWRDTPPGQIGFVRKCGSPDPSIRPAETAPIKCGKSEGQVWMRLEGGKQISGSAYGDIKVEFQGIEPGVFVLNSSGSFDEFVVEGTPDPEWVARRWRAILSGL